MDSLAAILPMRLIFFFFAAFFLLMSMVIGRGQWALINSPDHIQYQINQNELHAIRLISDWQRQFKQENNRPPDARGKEAWTATRTDKVYLSFFSILRSGAPKEIIETYGNIPPTGTIYKFRNKDMKVIYHPSWGDKQIGIFADKDIFVLGSRMADLAMGWMFLLCTLLGAMLFSREAIRATE